MLVQILRHWHRFKGLADRGFGTLGSFEFGRHDQASQVSWVAKGLVEIKEPHFSYVEGSETKLQGLRGINTGDIRIIWEGIL